MISSARNRYSEDEMLSLSGIQHYMFCPRQWALIHLEQQWIDNLLTTEGSMLHENVDNPSLRETNGSSTITLRGVRVASSALGLNGIVDAVEIIPNEGAPLTKKALLRSKQFKALPVEYKHGRSKANDCDRIQVVAQAMMLEDMLGVEIKCGAIFYWQPRHREYFDITPALRHQVEMIAAEMHHLFRLGCSPLPKKTRACRSCSLNDLCVPALANNNVANYLNSHFDEETT